MAENRVSTPVINLAPDSLAFPLFLGAMVACGLYAAFIATPEMRAAAQQQLVEALTDENRSFCERFGMRVGSNEFVACNEGLAIVRQKQAARDSAAANGF
ncbi:hypothetical protein BSZ21_01675 [Bradyrhizobium canariense]|uniref:hypothetical protein n=1 Tax=Bradyrhizobium canariense TaxID=255045 RepID=UPI000A196AEF|nr:hypothetical protein [Bradyrhizobium canariense]OSI79113.1 hypothetical protein BSZ21_01675 [Bradyrhizobium canariense]